MLDINYRIKFVYDEQNQVEAETPISFLKNRLDFRDLNAFVEYKNITSYGKQQDSILIWVKAEGQEDEDDQQQGLESIKKLQRRDQQNNIQGSLTIQIYIPNNQIQDFIKLYQNYQKESIHEENQEQVLSSDSEEDEEDDENILT
ncbi:hypothetical protein pb186bvf_007643 [Paramecium bursaria]